MLVDIQNFFTVVFSKKFSRKSMPHRPSHPGYVAALPCET